jgi:hypothetical protein
MRNVIVITGDVHWRRLSCKENVTPAAERIKMKMKQ